MPEMGKPSGRGLMNQLRGKPSRDLKVGSIFAGTCRNGILMHPPAEKGAL